ncbi:50S ribosomal protein L6 [Candidatus Micrarchaeota archaeon]|nr:50S ribosomal protein L6 [Candidatus Micrarchaeota archaeon]MBU1165938.1 50S ribosomal protein L6 [Candidatus Micrarchaeota archaeon]MBU1886842.1 50S ribosomal protein L6 [Candidatus Micrarchaeota archaeon]
MVTILEGVNVRIDDQILVVKGPLGELHRTIPKIVQVKINGNKLELSVNNPALKGTLESVINSMVIGVTTGYKRNLKLLHAHFPISIEVKGRDMFIKNFLGEKQPRKTIVVGTTKVDVKGQSVTISGPDKEAVGQTIGNMKNAMKIKKKDARTFQDGIYELDKE